MAMRIRITKVTAPDVLGVQLMAPMSRLGDALGARGQRLVPKRTWALHDSFEKDVKRDGAKVTLEVAATAPYAVHVERGTSRQGAQPYLRPALAQSSARDLDYSGRGITRHGVVTFSTRRSRTRARSGRSGGAR